MVKPRYPIWGADMAFLITGEVLFVSVLTIEVPLCWVPRGLFCECPYNRSPAVSGPLWKLPYRSSKAFALLWQPWSQLVACKVS